MRELKVFRVDHLGYTWCQMCMWKGNPGKCDETFAADPDEHLGYEDKCDGCEKPQKEWHGQPWHTNGHLPVWPEGCINKHIEQWGEPLRRQGFSEKNIYKEWWAKHYGIPHQEIERELKLQREALNPFHWPIAKEKADG